MNRDTSEFDPSPDAIPESTGLSNPGVVELINYVLELRMENTRLQALICDLLAENEQLRRTSNSS